MTSELLAQLLLHERLCWAELAAAEKYQMKDTSPRDRARERWEEAHEWVQLSVGRALNPLRDKEG